MDRKPSSSSLLLALAVGIVLCTGLALLLQQGPAVEGAAGTGAVAVELAMDGPTPTASLTDLGPLGPIERDPIEFPDGPSYDWIVTGEERVEAEARGELTPVAPDRATPSGEARPGAALAGQDDAVAAYLSEVDFALQAGAWWSDSHALAQQVLSEAMTGETASVGDLRRSNAEVLRRVSALDAPPEARAHQRATVEVLREGDALLAEWEAAVETGDLEALAGFASSAEALRTSAAEVDALTAALSR